MTKKELATAVAKNTDLTIAKSEEVLNEVLEQVKKSLREGDTVSLLGFGNFKTVTRSARTGFNPQNRQSIEIPEKTVAKFVPSKNFL